MNIVVNPELQAYIDPLTPDEHAALERSLLDEGCRDALVLWGEVLVDGHNRYGICQKHGLPFKTLQATHFKTMEDVHLWMIDQHLGRRSVSDFQRGVLALRKREILAARKAPAASVGADQAGAATEAPPDAGPADAGDATGAPGAALALNSREAIARAARLSSSQVVMIEKIQKQAAPELVAALKSGAISLNAAAAVASLPAEEQAAAATGGRDQLKQAAKRVREAKRKAREEMAPATPPEGHSGGDDGDSLPALRQRVADLTAENIALRRQVGELQERLGMPAF